MEFRQINHQTRQDRLAFMIRRSGKTARKMETDLRRLFIDFDSSTETEHIIDGTLDQPYCARDCGTNNVAARFRVSAVTLHIKADDPAFFHME